MLFRSSESFSVEIVRVPYEMGVTQEKMRREEFPDFLIQRLAEGR